MLSEGKSEMNAASFEHIDSAILAIQQNVKPVTDIEELTGSNIWPDEDDIDEFLETLNRWRQEDIPRGVA